MSNKKEPKEVRGTLKHLTPQMSEEKMYYRNRLLMLAHQLSDVQIKIFREIQDILESESKYKFEVKHNHNEIKKLIRKNRPDMFGNSKDFENMDRYCDEVDALGEAIFRMAKIDNLCEKW